MTTCVSNASKAKDAKCVASSRNAPKSSCNAIDAERNKPRIARSQRRLRISKPNESKGASPPSFPQRAHICGIRQTRKRRAHPRCVHGVIDDAVSGGHRPTHSKNLSTQAYGQGLWLG